MNENFKQQRFKSIDVPFYWLRDRIKQDQFCLSWAPAHTNLADYPSKHHEQIHHKKMRNFCVHTKLYLDLPVILVTHCLLVTDQSRIDG